MDYLILGEYVGLQKYGIYAYVMQIKVAKFTSNRKVSISTFVVRLCRCLGVHYSYTKECIVVRRKSLRGLYFQLLWAVYSCPLDVELQVAVATQRPVLFRCSLYSVMTFH